jgi:hypothetical protein
MEGVTENTPSGNQDDAMDRVSQCLAVVLLPLPHLELASRQGPAPAPRLMTLQHEMLNL